jgi:hypothetical protein
MPPELQYQPPRPSAATATIRGSQETVPLLDDYTVYVLGVDGKRVMTGRAGWSSALPLVAGKRRIGVAFQRGVLRAQAEIHVDVEPGRAYEVRYATDVQLYGTNSYVDFWVVDLTSGTAVTDVRRGHVNRGGDPPTYYVPIIVPK